MAAPRADYLVSLERGLLGLCLLDPVLLRRAERHLEAADWADARHARYYAAAIELQSRGADPSALSVGLELRRLGEFDPSDEAYLTELVADPGSVDPRSFDERVARVREESARRQAKALLVDGGKILDDRGAPLGESLGELRRQIGELEVKEGVEELPPIATTAEEILATLDSGVDPGTPTGLPNLDFAIQGGIKPSQLVVIAGSTGGGKTSLATQIALLAAQWAGREKTRGWVLFFSLEMSASELVIRMVSQVVPITDGYRPPEGFSRRDRVKVREGLTRMKALPMRIEVPRTATVAAIRGTIERHIVEHGKPALVVVDHIGLLKEPKVRGGRTEEVGMITRGLKEMAMQLNLPVVALAQLNREVGKREDHRPQLTDLRESGSIEQDANIVMLVHRPSYFLPPESRALEEARGAEALVYIAKNRSGPTAEVRFEWVGPRYLFRLPTDWTERNPALVDDESIIDHSAQALPAGDDPDAALFGDGSATPDPGAPTETPLLGEGGSPSEPDEAAGDSDEAAELFA
jgi:replicative DNA helicase